MIRRVKPSGEPVAINVRPNIRRDVGTHEIGLAQITASASIIIMQKVRGVIMTTSNYGRSARLPRDQKRIRVRAAKNGGHVAIAFVGIMLLGDQKRIRVRARIFVILCLFN